MLDKIQRNLHLLIFPAILGLSVLTYNFAGAQELPSLISCTTVRECILQAVGNLRGIVVGITVVVIIIAGVIYLFSGANVSIAEKAKKTLIGAVVGFAIVLGADILINEIGRALGWKGTTNTTGAKDIVTRMINFLFALLGLIGMAGILMGAIMYFASGGDEGRAKSGKTMVIYSIIGVVIALSAVIIVRQVETIFGQ